MSLTYNMEGMHTFCLTEALNNSYFLVTETMVQRAVDGVNMAVKQYPDAWEFVRQGHLIKDEEEYGSVGNHPVAKIIFREMMKDDHTGATAASVVTAITNLARQRGLDNGLSKIG